MAKFSLSKAKAEAKAYSDTIESGYHRAIIVQVAEIGLQKAFNAGDDPKASAAFTFENAEGQQVVKTMALSMSIYSNFNKLLAVVGDIEEMEGFLGEELDIEVEENGNYPKIIGYYHLEDRMSDQPEIADHSSLIYYTVEEPQPEVLKSLHPQIKQAIASRVRIKE